MTVRQAGPREAWTLISAGWLSTVAATLLSPLLPTLARQFSGEPGLQIKLALVATGPALFVALLAPVAGWLGDRLGHKRILFWAVTGYGLVGILPIALDRLNLIVVSRAAVGIAEAVIVTSANALIATYFSGGTRQKWLALEAGTAPIVATVMLALGGALGALSWRAPFGIYGLTFLLIPAVAALPTPPRAPVQSLAAAKEPLGALHLASISLITFFGVAIFFVAVIQFGFLFASRTNASPQQIGLWLAVSSIANPLGALAFSRLRISLFGRLALSFVLFALGLLIIVAVAGPGAVVAGALIINGGAGMFLPGVVTWIMSDLPPSRRGAGIGTWTSAFFLGQFASPLIYMAIRSIHGSPNTPLIVYGLVSLVGAVGFLIAPKRLAPSAL